MKVLQIINSLGAGGAEKLVTEALIRYREKGLEAEILLLQNPTTPLLERLVSLNVPVHGLGPKNNMYSPLNILKMRPFLKRYDLIHVHLFPSSYFITFASLLSKKRPVIFTEHNTTNKRRKLKILKPLEKFVYNRFDKVVSISDAVHKSIQEHLGPSFTKIIKIYNGINLKEINAADPLNREEMGFSKDDVLLLQVSSFTPQKNQQTVIESLTHLPEHIKLLLIGDGPLKNQIKDFTKSLGVADRVSFLGLRSDVPSLLKTVDIVVLSSHFEGLSLSSVEGLCSGKPFIASDVPGLSEVVKGAGLLFPDGDSKSLANHIHQLSKNETFKEEVAAKCKKRAEDFDQETMVNSYMQLYRELYTKYNPKSP